MFCEILSACESLNLQLHGPIHGLKIISVEIIVNIEITINKLS